MNDKMSDLLITLVIFIIMGTLKLVATIAGSNTKISIRQKFNVFYVNTVAGWGFFSLLISYDDWFGKLPQKIFIIMSVTYVGFNILNSTKFLNFVKKFFEYVTKN